MNPGRDSDVRHDLAEGRRAAAFNEKTKDILQLIAIGRPAREIYHAIALMYEGRHPGMRCSMLELEGNTLLHGGAPSMPKAYCEAIHGLEIGPNIGSCGTSTFTGERCLVEDIETDPKWQHIKHHALPHGLRCCWSEPIKSSAGKVLGAFGMYYDHPALPSADELDDLASAARLAAIVMERDQAQKRIRRLAFSDELTGLSNRTHFYQQLEKLIKTSQRYRRQFGLLYLDVDDFKRINDSMGHDAGDILLREIAVRLQSVCRETDFVARLSGDEFCVVIDNIRDEADSSLLAQRCLEVVSQKLDINSRVHYPGCSIGIAHYPHDGSDASTLLKAADTAMYAAKGRGKNQFTFYQQELTLKAEHRVQVEHYLREAIEKRELTLAYQPQIDLASNRITGVEALCRWHHASLGWVSPQEFIATAERIGMIKPLTAWVMQTACAQAVFWRDVYQQDLSLSVNIPASHFLAPELVALVDEVIATSGIDSAALVLEVTESALQADPDNIAVFEGLKKRGVDIAIDDFGMGYSSFASLKHVQVDTLKIDRYFIDDVVSDQHSRLLVSAMVSMGRDLGHKVIAEGVETSAQVGALKDMGCDIAQGFFFSKPVSAEEISALLQQHKRV